MVTVFVILSKACYNSKLVVLQQLQAGSQCYETIPNVVLDDID